MCEWLSYGEWCDVKLLCGGRAFSAHRAVLASVSTFLRRLLLSCPIDESPTFILLPEFDLDAMSSVLYYIYNGEVTVKKQKFDMFLDIIKAMQIFIDSQYLPPRDLKNYINLDLECHLENNLSKSNRFSLRYEDLQDKTYINLRKGNQIQEVLSKYLQNSSAIHSQYTSEKSVSSLGNLKSSYGNQQKNSFLRDLFIETYPRNGNNNGLTADVLAISNEVYHAPASVLLTNANGNHLSTDDILLESYEKTNEYISDSPTVLHLKKRCTPDEQDHDERTKNSHEIFLKNINITEKIKNDNICEASVQGVRKNDWMSHIPSESNDFFQLGLQKQILSGLYVPSVDCSIIPSNSDTVSSIEACKSSIFIPGNSTLSNNENRNICKESKKITSKTTILNHVLDSPWSPRIPRGFKPFRIKAERSLSPPAPLKEAENFMVNDSNNNVYRSDLSVDLDTDGVSTAAKSNTATILEITPDIVPYKCGICYQVFMSRDLLSVHMRRHSKNARYTCGECDKTFSQLRNFKYHMSIHRGTREFATTCTVCGKYFNDRGYLSSHMKIHRNRKEYKCTLCPKSFNQRVAYNMHVRIHTGIKPHVCEQCGKAFSRKMLLKQHLRTHSGERPYACPHCDKRFADRSNMTLHLRLHTGIKPFSCTICPKSFTKKHHLKSHLNFHTGSKPYSCPRCKLTFTQSSNMRTHLKKCQAPELTDTEISSAMEKIYIIIIICYYAFNVGYFLRRFNVRYY